MHAFMYERHLLLLTLQVAVMRRVTLTSVACTVQARTRVVTPNREVADSFIAVLPAGYPAAVAHQSKVTSFEVVPDNTQ